MDPNRRFFEHPLNMTDNAQPNRDANTEQRLVRIESALAHIQQDIDSLNSSLLHHLQQIQAFEGRCNRLESAIQQINEDAEHRDPGLEQPPHY
jgi:uncharacterized coiled-coil protein SlyX